MPITTLDGVVAGARAPLDVLKTPVAFEGAGVLASLFYANGNPGAAIVPTPGVAGASLTSYAGQVPFNNPTGGQFTYLARMSCSASTAGTVSLLDRLWHNSGLIVTTTTAQTVGSPAWPARDRTGLTDGANLQVALEVSTGTTNASAITNFTLGYTNSAGVAGRVGTMASFPGTAVAGSLAPFQLQAGDVGLRSIESVTFGTSMVTGSVHLVVYRELGTVGLSVPNVAADINPVTGGFPRLYDNSVPFLVWTPTGTGPITLQSRIFLAQG